MLRLTSKKDYSLLRHSARKVVGKYFIAVYLVDSNIDESAAGITVSRKVGKAVVRNKIRRRIKAFLHGYDVQTTPVRFYCNIIALPSAIGVDWKLFKRDLENCFERLLKVMNNDYSSKLCPAGVWERK